MRRLGNAMQGRLAGMPVELTGRAITQAVAGGGASVELSIAGTPPAATYEVAYSWTPSVSGGTPPYSFAITAGVLPTGLSLNASTGAVSGTSTNAGSSGFTITVTDADLATAPLATSITVNAVVPDAPTIGTATAGNAQASVAFTAPADNGGSAITGYRVTSSPGGLTATGASSPIVVTGLTNGVAYTFTVAALNAIGYSAESAASNSVTPSAVTLALTNRSLSAAAFEGVTLLRAGAATAYNAGTPFSGEWVASGATGTIGDDYEAFFTRNSGTAGSPGDFGSWRRINATLNAYLTTSGSITVQIRPFGGGSVLASATYTITVT